MKKKKRTKEKQIAIKMIKSLIYLITITFLLVTIYHMITEQQKIKPWDEVENIKDYTYIDISKMSEKFAYYKESNIGIHYVIEREETGVWHTYLIAINEDDYKKYKDIIDYTYERTDKIPKTKRVYGYPVIIDSKLKELAIKNIKNFVPAENEVTITEENYEKYLTNSYLDTTQERKEEFNLILYSLFLVLIIVILLFILNITDKDNKKKIRKKE